MQELLKQIQEAREQAYRAYMEAELTADEAGLAHTEGILEGMDIMINLVQENTR